MSQRPNELLIAGLWAHYLQHSTQAQPILDCLQTPYFLDHLAIIDLPGPNSGIPALRELFTQLGFIERGHGYLPDKINDFIWMVDQKALTQKAENALPQVVLADFRLHDMPEQIRKIIEKYSHTAAKPPQPEQGLEEIITYLTTREWNAPTCEEFALVNRFNPLLAWVLAQGRKPNHFTLSIHLLKQFTSLSDFNAFIQNQVGLALNQEGGLIKGNSTVGIEQSSTQGIARKIKLQDGEIEIPADFVEFVWRYPVTKENKEELLWIDYYTGFIPQQANRVIESLRGA